MTPLLRMFIISPNHMARIYTNNMTAGFARAIQGISSGNGWDHLYDMSYFYGFFASLTMHWLFHTVFAAERQRGSSPFVLEDHADMIHVGESDSGTAEIVVETDKMANMTKL